MVNFGGWNPLGSKVKALSAGFKGRAAFFTKALSGDAKGKSTNFGKKIKSSLQGFPLKAGITSGGLALTGDTIAQFLGRSRRRKAIEEEAESLSPCCKSNKLKEAPGLWDHDPIRALRMASYGFLCYGPGSHFWYQFLDATFPGKSFVNFIIKVTANQVALGPAVISVVFTWNYAWMKKLNELPEKFQSDFMPTLYAGWKFWIPMAFINFGVVPLPARVAFMSCCSIFWNFYLSMTVGNSTPISQTPKNE